MEWVIPAFAIGIVGPIAFYFLKKLNKFSDATNLILLFLVPLFIIPSPYVVGQFGGTASPSMLLGIGMFYIWVMSLVHPPLAKYRKPNVLHIAWFVFFAAMLMSVFAAFSRVLTSTESQAPIRGLVILFGFSGIMLFTADGISNRRNLNLILRAFVYLGSFVAITGILQYMTNIDLASMLKIPGLSVVNFGEFVGTRNGLKRVSGTAYHPIEYATVLCALLPISWHVAKWGYKEYGRRYDYIPLGIIAFAIPFSLSRTAIIALALIAAALIPMLTFQQKINAAAYSILFLAFIAIAQRGVLRTFLNLFENAGNDDSISGRTEDYERLDIMDGYEWFGRGLKTFDPREYFFIDNQFLLGYIETGYVGVAATIVLIGTALVQAYRIRKHANDQRTKELASVLLASILGIFGCFLTFDTLSFPMIALMLFFLIGIVAALGRLENTATFGWLYRSTPNKKDESQDDNKTKQKLTK